MTTLFRETKQCSVCGSEAEYTDLSSTNTIGSTDLDTRPPEMRRSTMFTWVQRCVACGYCNFDVSELRLGAPAVIDTIDYRRQLTCPDSPELANTFLCAAMTGQAAGSYASATWSLVHAAWVCDDAGQLENAGTCRGKAAVMLLVAQEHGQNVGSDDRTSSVILVDLLRRSGQAEKARQLISKQRGRRPRDVISRMLAYQTVLLDENDTDCHTIADALKNDRAVRRRKH